MSNWYFKEKILELVRGLLIILVLVLALNWLMCILGSEKSQLFVRRAGFFGPLLIIFYIVLSHVLVPLSVTPGVLLSLLLFGAYQTAIYLYLAGKISAIVNFYIARKFGRTWVTKLVGKKAMREIDEFVELSETKLLIIARLFGFPFFDVVSYAVGLTKVSFKKYFIITLIFSFPSSFCLNLILFKNVDFASKTNLLISLGGFITVGMIFSLLVEKYLRQKKKNEQSDTGN